MAAMFDNMIAKRGAELPTDFNAAKSATSDRENPPLWFGRSKSTH